MIRFIWLSLLMVTFLQACTFHSYKSVAFNLASHNPTPKERVISPDIIDENGAYVSIPSASSGKELTRDVFRLDEMHFSVPEFWGLLAPSSFSSKTFSNAKKRELKGIPTHFDKKKINIIRGFLHQREPESSFYLYLLVDTNLSNERDVDSAMLGFLCDFASRVSSPVIHNTNYIMETLPLLAPINKHLASYENIDYLKKITLEEFKLIYDKSNAREMMRLLGKEARKEKVLIVGSKIPLNHLLLDNFYQVSEQETILLNEVYNKEENELQKYTSTIGLTGYSSDEIFNILKSLRLGIESPEPNHSNDGNSSALLSTLNDIKEPKWSRMLRNVVKHFNSVIGSAHANSLLPKCT